MKTLPVFCLLIFSLFLISATAQSAFVTTDPTWAPVHHHKSSRASQEVLISSASYQAGSSLPVAYDSATYVYADPAAPFTATGAFAWTESDQVQLNNATRTFFNSNRMTRTLDAQGTELSVVLEQYDTFSNSYQNSLQWTTTYDAANNKQSVTVQTWNTASNAWVNSTRTLYSYNSTHHRTGSITEVWPPTATAWQANSSDTFFLNAAGDDTLWINRRWDSASHVWINAIEYISTYSPSGNKVQRLSYLWSGSAWNSMPDARINWAFDTDNNQIFQANLSWNANTSAWDSIYRFTWSYDSYGNQDISTQHSWLGTGQYDNVHRYHYQLVATGIEDQSAGSARIYPNPATDHIFISSPVAADIEIYNTVGDLIRSAAVSDSRAMDINTSALPAGLYIAHVKYEDSTSTISKFIKN